MLGGDGRQHMGKRLGLGEEDKHPRSRVNRRWCGLHGTASGNLRWRNNCVAISTMAGGKARAERMAVHCQYRLAIA